MTKFEAIVAELGLKPSNAVLVLLDSPEGRKALELVKTHEDMRPKQPGKDKKAQVVTALEVFVRKRLSPESVDTLVELAVATIKGKPIEDSEIGPEFEPSDVVMGTGTDAQEEESAA